MSNDEGSKPTEPSEKTPAKGVAQLTTQAIVGLTDVVEAMHAAVTHPLGMPDPAKEGRTGGLTGLVYRTIRGITGVVGAGVEQLMDLTELHVEDVVDVETEGFAQAIVNGIVGDRLEDSDNPLAIKMSLRSGGRALSEEEETLRAQLGEVSGKVLVLVHGSSMGDQQWSWKGHDHGEMLKKALGFTPVYLRYNSGLHISTNGQEFAQQLDELLQRWPVPVDEVVIIGFSMGGLVTRSACFYGARSGAMWFDKLRAMVTLGTPHHGAMLERGGNWFQLLLGATPYASPLAKLAEVRSAGITDLRYGSLLDSDWQGKDRFVVSVDQRSSVPLPDGVEVYLVAGTLRSSEEALGAKTLGDGLVPVKSALGHHGKESHTLSVPEDHTLLVYGTRHMDLLCSEEVGRKLVEWLQ